MKKLICGLIFTSLFTSAYAQEFDASNTVIVKAHPLLNTNNCSLPKYTTETLKSEQTGTVELKYLVDSNGQIVDSKIEKSSGFRELDRKSLNSIKKCSFDMPSKRNVDQLNATTWMRVNVVWNITE